MRNALAKSINLATVDMAMQVGLDNIISMAARFGFSTTLRTFPSIALGSFEVVPIELATAYCAFAADGVLPYPLALNDVVDENGTILQRRHIAIKSILSPAKAFIMSSMLRSVVTDGTARSLKGLGIALPVCGKTGTTNNFRDAWFVGYTPDILALVWVGFDNGDSIFSTGAGAALPIWADLIKSIPQYISGNFFTNPPGVVKKIICVESGQLAIAGRCPETIEEFILSENMPEESCSFHKHSGSLKRILKGVKDLF
jgi:penicillin-binding protein 1B